MNSPRARGRGADRASAAQGTLNGRNHRAAPMSVQFAASSPCGVFGPGKPQDQSLVESNIAGLVGASFRERGTPRAGIARPAFSSAAPALAGPRCAPPNMPAGRPHRSKAAKIVGLSFIAGRLIRNPFGPFVTASERLHSRLRQSSCEQFQPYLPHRSQGLRIFLQLFQGFDTLRIAYGDCFRHKRCWPP